MNDRGQLLNGCVTLTDLPAAAEHSVGAEKPPRWFIRAFGVVLAGVAVLVIGPFLALYAGLCWRLFWVGAGN